MKKINWVHRLTLPDGTVTKGDWDNLLQGTNIDFNKKRVLDIGCLDGQYTFYAEQEGAKEVISIDIIEDKKNKKSYPQAAYTNEGYLYAHKLLKSKAKYIFPFSVYDLTIEKFGQFDIVLFLGVIYHLAHPLFALEKINTVLKKDGIMVIESEISKSISRFYHTNQLNHNPIIIEKSVSSKTKIKNKIMGTFGDILENNEIYNNDTSVFWVPTKKDLERFIDFAGFLIEKTVEDPGTNRVTYVCRKIEEPSATYSINSQYTSYKNRNTTL